MIQVLGLACIALLFVKYFSPVQPLRNWIVDKLIHWMVTKNWNWLFYPIQILSCPFCFSFWLTLGLTLSLYKAAIASVITMVALYTVESLMKYLGDEGKKA